MARGQKNNRALVREAQKALDDFKYQVANQIGVKPPADAYWGDIPSRQCGAVGGQTARSMIQMADQPLAPAGTTPPPAWARGPGRT